MSRTVRRVGAVGTVRKGREVGGGEAGGGGGGQRVAVGDSREGIGAPSDCSYGSGDSDGGYGGGGG